MLKKTSQKFYLFKTLLKLKAIIQKKKLIKRFLKLKKKKWNFFKISLVNSLKYRKIYKLFDIFKFSFKKKGNGVSQKKKNLYFQNNKKLLKIFYGKLLNSYFKKFVKNNIMSFLNKLESRLDIFLYRYFLFPSILFSRKVIKQGYIFINKKKINNFSYEVKKGDVISFNLKKKKKLIKNIVFTNFWPVCLDNVIINYSILEIICKNSIKIKNNFKFYYYYINLTALFL